MILFFIYCPASIFVVGAARPILIYPKAPWQPRGKATLRAAIVDDYPIMRELLREFLKRADFEVVGEAGTGAELLDGYAEWRPDVVILDLLLPDANGVDVTRALLLKDPKAKVLIVSGLEADRQLTEKCLEAGAKALLPKPFTSEDLIRAVRAL